MSMFTEPAETAVVTDRATASGVLIQVSGAVDVHSAPIIDTVLRRAMSHPTHRVDVDLAAVTFLSVAGLQPLLTAHREHPGRVTLVAASHPVQRLLHVLDLDSTLRPATGGRLP